jgi:hypothetical protein
VGSNARRDKFWNRSGPVLGIVSGLFSAVYLHLVGVPDDA